MTLTKKAKEKLASDEVKMKICLELNIAYNTIRRWLKNENVDDKFTTKKSIFAIVKHTGLTEDEIFELEISS